MNPDPDYSAAYVVLRTDAADGHEGHGFTFTIGRGNDVQVAAIEALRGHLLGRSVDDLCADPGTLSRDLVGDSQLRWLGPEKGVMHMAIGAVVNAAWDLAAKRAGKPLWRLLADAEPDWLVRQIDFRYLTDALTPDEALTLLRRGREGADGRRARLLERGYPAYTTSMRLARLRRRQAHPPRPPGRRRRLPSDQAEGRRRPRRRHPALPGGPRRRGPGRADRDRRQPALGHRRGDPLDPGPRRVRPLLDRGAHQPRRHPRPRRRPRGGRPGQGRHRRARPQPRRLQTAPPGGRPRHPPARRGPRRGRQREPRDPAARRQVRGPRLPARRMASACANSSSTCRCSTTWP